MKEILESLKSDALLITKKEDVFYHSGFNGSFGILLATKNKKYLITDPRYSHFKNKNIETIILTEAKKDIGNLVKKTKIESVAFQATDLKYESYWNLKKLFKPCKFIKDKSFISNLREIKTAQEIKKLQKAQEINERTLNDALPYLKEGISEQEFANIIKINAFVNGASGFSFEPIVAFGKNSANIHHQPSSKTLSKNDIVLIDMGVSYENYQSDMSRTFLPKKSTQQMQNDYKKVLNSFQTGIKNAMHGISTKKLDELSRKELEPDNFNHALGHGIGLETHELPFFSKNSSKKLIKNMVITIEPGLYRTNQYGIRIEDAVIVGDKSGKSLTNFPSDISQVIWG